MGNSAKSNVVTPSAVLIVLCVSLFVAGWWLLRVAVEHFGAQKIADKYTAIRQFKQDLNPNHANTRIVFCQDTEHGVGIFFCNTDNGQPCLLCEKKENGLQWRRFTMLGWSSDDSLFACALPDEKQEKESVLIFDGQKAEKLAQLTVNQGLHQFVWLTTDTFAYSTHTDVGVVIRRGNDWEHKRYFEKIATDVENLIAYSSHSLAWRDGKNIWSFDIDSGTPPKSIWEATNTLVEFTCDSGELLLNCSGEKGQYLLRFDPRENRIVDAGSIGPYQDYIRNVSWTRYGPAYAFLTNNLAGSTFCMKSGENSDAFVTWDGGVGSFTLNGQHLFFTGNSESGTPKIWDYSLESKTFTAVCSSKGDWAREFVTRPAICGVLTNSLGQKRFYHLWMPNSLEPSKRHPVLLAQEMNNWYPYLRIATECGYVVAVVDRPFSHTWNGSQQRTWMEDVEGLYAILTNNAAIDARRAYFFAYSAETFYLSVLLNREPQLWEGAVLFSPGSLPDVARLRGKRILLVAGKNDQETIPLVLKYQSDAAAAGTPITLCVLPKAGHTPESVDSERIRNRHLARFLSANRS